MIGHVQHFEALGRARFAAEQSRTPIPMAADLQPGTWRVEGRLGPGQASRPPGHGRRCATGGARRKGISPSSSIPGSGSPRHGPARARWRSPGPGTASPWSSTPPIPPGGRREILFHLVGEPAEAMVDPQIFDFPSFHNRFGNHLHARFARELIDFSTSYEAPAISPRRVQLLAADLSPIPRYQSWKLDEDLRVQEEAYSPQATSRSRSRGCRKPSGRHVRGRQPLGAPRGRLPACLDGARRGRRHLSDPAGVGERHHGGRLSRPTSRPGCKASPE